MSRLPPSSPPRPGYSATVPASVSAAGQSSPNTGVVSGGGISLLGLLKWFLIGGASVGAIGGVLFLLRRLRLGGMTPSPNRAITTAAAKKKKVEIPIEDASETTPGEGDEEENKVSPRNIRFSDEEEEADEVATGLEKIEQDFIQKVNDLLEPSSDKEPQPAKAIKLCDAMIAKYPQMRSAWTSKAEAQGRAGKFKEMEKTYNLALKKFKNDVIIFIAKMNSILQYSEDVRPVLREMSAAEKRYSKSAQFYVFFGQLLRAMRYYPEARKLIVKAIELDPLSPDTHYSLAEILTAEDEHEKALESLNRAERLVLPGSKDITDTVRRMKYKIFKSEVLRYLCRYEEAVQAIDECLKSDAKLSRAPTILLRKAVLLTDMERWKEAVDLLKELATDKDIESTADELHLQLAQAMLIGDPSMFDPALALEHIDTQLKYHPAREASTSHLFRAMALAACKRYAEAHEVLNAATSVLHTLAAQAFKENPKLAEQQGDSMKQVEQRLMREWLLGKAFVFAEEGKIDEALALLSTLTAGKDSDHWASDFQSALQSDSHTFMPWHEMFRRRRAEMALKAKEAITNKKSAPQILKTSSNSAINGSSSSSNGSPMPPSTSIAADPVTVKTIGTMD